MPSPARRCVAPWPAVMIVWGPGFRAAEHNHHCVQLIVALHGTLLVRKGRRKPWMRCGATWIQIDATHEVDARGTTLLIVFINAESDLGTALSKGIEDGIARVSAREVNRWRAVLGLTPDEARAAQWVTTFLPRPERARKIHPGVQRVLRHLHEPEAILNNLSLRTLSEIAGLSPSRFMHAFTESVHVPVRPYILWLRLQQAACDLRNGVNVTSAAHRAGFSDASHLTRTFRRMLGATPSDLALLKRLTVGFALEGNECSEPVTEHSSSLALF
jgi:AraC-like DNA-binding protein